MTPKQIERKLIKSGIDISELTFGRDEIEIACGYEETDRGGNCDENLIEKKHKEILEVLPEFAGGYYSGYGSFVAKIGYESNGDWNDPSSKWHY